jgi:formate hydrogenlyase subunit 3/multisubunit Na+/H+ antiporter MnhD subunit
MIASVLLPAAVAVPLLAALVVVVLPVRPRLARPVTVAATVPALVLAVVGSDASLTMSWLLLGADLALDGVGRVLLVLTSVLWLASSLSLGALVGDRGWKRFLVCFLVTMAGNFGVLVSADAGTFYLSFVLMTFAAYGLVVHDGTAKSWYAGRVYVAMAVLGEAFLLIGLVLAVQSAGTLALGEIPAGVADAPLSGLIVGLLLAGFGVKAGAPLLHMWLPLAHPAAPVPASAVLSGCMIKAGLLGWLRFLPIGESGFDSWAVLAVAAGITAALVAAAIGVTQKNAKVVLAYSSISQMGSMLLLVGLALSTPGDSEPAVDGAVVFALHHGLAKGALFLGVGVLAATARPGARRWILAGLTLPALALAGAPLTGGTVAKTMVTDAAALGPPDWLSWLDLALPATAIATTALMARFLLIERSAPVTRNESVPWGPLIPWTALLVAGSVLIWVVPAAYLPDLPPLDFVGTAIAWTAVWPVVAGLALAGGAVAVARRHPALAALGVPPGDVVVWVDRAVEAAGFAIGEIRRTALVGSTARGWSEKPDGAVAPRPGRLSVAMTGMERRMADWRVAGSLFITMTVVLVVVARWL